jgi:hypothetical protein
MIFTSKSNHMIRFVVTPGILCFGRTKYAYSISLIIIDQIHIRILIKIWKLVRRVVILTTYNKSTNNFIGLSHNKLNTKVSKMCIKKHLQLLIISSNSMTFIFFLFKLSTIYFESISQSTNLESISMQGGMIGFWRAQSAPKHL